MVELDLTFPNIPIGTHETPWDLKVLLYKGAGTKPRRFVMQSIIDGEFGSIVLSRVSLVKAFHEQISYMVKLGLSRFTIDSVLETLRRFYTWADNHSLEINKPSVFGIFKQWAEHLVHRYQIIKDISAMTGYREASRLANIIVKTLHLPGEKPGKNLLMQTRIRRPKPKKSVLGTQASKQNINHTFEFGTALKRICDVLDFTTVRGKLPIRIILENNKTILLAGCLMKPNLNVDDIKDSFARSLAIKARAPLEENESLFERHKRSGILNLRIEAELLIFIAQTGMNLAQVAELKRNNYRWKTVGDELEVFRVFKGRRDGEAIFRCFKVYKEHFKLYLEWLDTIGLTEFDLRLFPLQYRGIIPAKGSKVKLKNSRGVFKAIDMTFIGPQELRKTRVNWLLRRHNNVNLTAEQMAHDKSVLLRDYERPHHQSAASEIVNFYSKTDSVIAASGPGVCIDSHQPQPINGISSDSPIPDCISPEGCLFCTNHRDIMSYDYCWKLVSHARIKSLETNLYKHINKQDLPTSYRVIDRINLKLDIISEANIKQKKWVNNAKDSVRAGKYHPQWKGHIELFEIFS